MKDLYKLIIFARKNSIDIIHSHGRGAGIIGRILKIFIKKPLIYTFHGIHIDTLGIINKKLYLIYERAAGWIDNHKIFVSSTELSQAKYFKLIINKNFSIINNATKNMRFRKNKPKSKNNTIGINNQKKNIISVCRLVDQKNIFEIFRIAKKLTDYNFLILGNGYLYNDAKKYIHINKLKNVYLLGNKEEIYKYLYISHLFLSCSLYEGHPISILEAMSVGLPIVASKVIGNCNTIKDNHSGLFYKLGDINDAVSCIEKIMRNKTISNKFSRNAFARQRKLFSINKMKLSYINLYKNHI